MAYTLSIHYNHLPTAHRWIFVLQVDLYKYVHINKINIHPVSARAFVMMPTYYTATTADSERPSSSDISTDTAGCSLMF